MIEINLLPGSKKAKRGGGGGGLPKLNFGVLANIGGSLKDPFLAIALGGVVIGLLGTGYQFQALSSRDAALVEREQQAVQDSTRYAAVLKERQAAEAQRDLVNRQLAIIQAIDGERFIWPHVLDEISAALPPYTWLTNISQTSPVASIASRDSLTGPASRQGAAAAAMAEQAPMTIRVVGKTVDIQALTRYMRVLESSPFLDGVNLVRSELAQEDSRDVTVFTLDLRYARPDSAAIRTEPLAVAVR
jgi:Tfp pilus assembly protein PilN